MQNPKSVFSIWVNITHTSISNILWDASGTLCLNEGCKVSLLPVWGNLFYLCLHSKVIAERAIFAHHLKNDNKINPDIQDFRVSFLVNAPEIPEMLN